MQIELHVGYPFVIKLSKWETDSIYLHKKGLNFVI